MLSVPQRYRQTDRQTDRRTDGRTTYDSNTALALRASRGKKHKDYNYVSGPDGRCDVRPFLRLQICVYPFTLLGSLDLDISLFHLQS